MFALSKECGGLTWPRRRTAESLACGDLSARSRTAHAVVSKGRVECRRPVYRNIALKAPVHPDHYRSHRT